MYAIIPAAGRSRRMGKPKLLLPWNDGTVIDHVLTVWSESRVDRVVVVVRAKDEELRAACQRHPVDLVTPETDPADMKQSVCYGIEHLTEHYAPRTDAAWMLAPADMPTIPVDVINRLIEAHIDHPSSILIPIFAGRRGHPVLIPWLLAPEVSKLGNNEGINSLIARNDSHEICMSDVACPEDLDSPADYDRLQSRGT